MAGGLAEVGARLVLAGKEAYIAGMREAAAANKSLESATRDLSAREQAAVDAKAKLLTANRNAAAATREYETAVRNQAKAEAEAAVSDDEAIKKKAQLAKARTDAALASKTAAEQEVASAKASADAAVVAADKEIAARERVKSAYEASAAVAKAAILGIGAASAAAAAVSVKMAADFQTSTNKLVTSAGESKQALDQVVRPGLLQMSGQLGVSATDLSAALYKISSASYHAQAGLGMLKAAEQGAKAEGADGVTVADALSSAMRDYYPNASKAADVTRLSADVMSKLVATTSQGKMTFDELASGLNNILPIASQYGIKMQDVLGVTASMTVHGISLQQATENINHAIQKLASGGTPQMAAAMASIGASALDVQQHLGDRGLAGTLQYLDQQVRKFQVPGSDKVILDLKNAVSKSSPAVQDLATQLAAGTISYNDFYKASKQLTGTDHAQVAAFNALLNNYHKLGDQQLSGLQVLQSYGGQMQRVTGDMTTLKVALFTTGENTNYTNTAIKNIAAATGDAAGNVASWSEVQDTFNQKLAELRYGLDAAAIRFGTALLPRLTEFIGYLQRTAGPILNSFGHGLAELGRGFMVVESVVHPNAPVPTGVTRGIATAVGAPNPAKLAGAIGSAFGGNLDYAPTAAGLTGVAGSIGGAMSGHLDAAPTAASVIGLAGAIGGAVAGPDPGVSAMAQLGAALRGIVNDLRTFGGEAKGAFKTFTDAAKPAAGLVTKEFVGALMALAHVLANQVGPFLQQTAGFLDRHQWIITALSQLIMGRLVFALLTFGGGKTLGLIKGVGSVFLDLMSPIGKVAGGILGLPGKVSDIAGTISGKLSWLKPFFTGLWDVATMAARGAAWLAVTTAKFVAAAASAAWNAAKTVAGWILGWVALIAGAAIQGAAWLAAVTAKFIAAAASASWNAAKVVAGWALSLASMIVTATVQGAVWLAIWIGRGVAAAASSVIQAGIAAGAWIVANIAMIAATGGIVLAIAAVIAIGVLIVKHWGWVKQTAKDVWNAIWGFVRDAAQWIEDKWNAVIDAGKKAWSSFWSEAEHLFSEGANKVIDIVNGFLDLVNKIAGAVGLHIDLHIGHVPAMASGGVLDFGEVGSGFITAKPRAIVGEGSSSHPEFVIPTDPVHRGNALNLYAQLARYIGAVPGYDSGGIIGDVWGGITSAASGAAHAVKGAVDWLGEVEAKGLRSVIEGVWPQLNVPGGLVGMVPGTLNKMRSSALAWLDSHYAPPAAGGGMAAAPAQVAAWIIQALDLMGKSHAFEPGVASLIMHESGGNPSAINLNDSNAKAGHPSQGLMQTIPSTFAAYVLPSLRGRSITDPVANITAGFRYAEANYGDAMLMAGGRHDSSGRYIGYESGGIIGLAARLGIPTRAIGGAVSAGQAYMVGESGPEIVVPRTPGVVIPQVGQGAGGSDSGSFGGALGSVTVNLGPVAIYESGNPRATYDAVRKGISDAIARR